jgi:hypothetical protein
VIVRKALNGVRSRFQVENEMAEDCIDEEDRAEMGYLEAKDPEVLPVAVVPVDDTALGETVPVEPGLVDTVSMQTASVETVSDGDFVPVESVQAKTVPTDDLVLVETVQKDQPPREIS